MTYIHHLTLNTGHTSRIKAGDVSGETLARVGPWIAALVDGGKTLPVPASKLADWMAHANVADGALVLTISAPSGLPVVTIGVAARSRHASRLWDELAKLAMVDPQQRPSAPWCAVVLWPALAMHIGATEWLGDIERCIAWEWINISTD